MTHSSSGEDRPESAAVASAVESICELGYLLKACVSSCHEPRQFLANLNAFIQAARNVTFRLQAHKREVADFDSWYEPWQSAMKSSDVMLWLRDARNKIVKQGGLTSLSTARVTVTSSYWNREESSFDVPPFTSTDAIIRAVGKRIQQPVDMVYGVIEVERRWVLEGMPELDALEVLAEVFRFCDCMLHDFVTRRCQGQAGLRPSDALGKWPTPVEPEELDAARAQTIAPLTGEDAGSIRTREIEAVSPEELRQHYGDDMPKPNPDLDDPVERVRSLMATACAILEKDGYHVSLFQLRHRGDGWRLIQVEFEDRPSKYRIMHELAEYVREQDVDALIHIAESWVLPADIQERFRFMPPTSVVDTLPDKSEALLFAAASADGTLKAWSIPFTRSEGRIRCPCEPVEMLGEFTMLDPIRAAWGISPTESP